MCNHRLLVVHIGEVRPDAPEPILSLNQPGDADLPGSATFPMKPDNVPYDEDSLFCNALTKLLGCRSQHRKVIVPETDRGQCPSSQGA